MKPPLSPPTQAQREQWEKDKLEQLEFDHIARTCVCAVCGSHLERPYDPKQGKRVVKCLSKDGHTGFKRVESYTEIWRRGGYVPPEIRQTLEHKEQLRRQELAEKGVEPAMTQQHNGPTTDQNPPTGSALAPRDPSAALTASRPPAGALSITSAPVLAAVVAERYPELDAKSVMLFCFHALRMGLDPLLGEIYPTVRVNHKTGAQVLVPIISEQGFLSLAARACPQAWNGPPSTDRVTDRHLKEDLCGDPEAWMYSATGRRKDWEPGREYTTHGWVTQAQWEEMKEKNLPAAELPGNQARIRAIKRWSLESYPEAASLLRAAINEVAEAAKGSTEAMALIEAEYTVLQEDGSQRPKLPQPARCPVHNQPLKSGKYGPYCPVRVTGKDGKMVYCKGQGAPATQAAPRTGEPQDDFDHTFGTGDAPPNGYHPVDPTTQGKATNPPAADAQAGPRKLSKDPTKHVPRTLADFTGGARYYFDLSPEHAAAALDLPDLTMIGDFPGAWASLLKQQGYKPGKEA